MNCATRGAGTFRGTMAVLSNVAVCAEHLRLTLGVSEFPKADPGSFVHLGPCASSAQAPAPFLRRAFSIAGLRRLPSGCELDVIYRVVGAGTRWLAGLRTGDSIQGLGPLGSGFVAPAPGKVAWLVAGGVGVPPLLWLAQRFGEAGQESVLLAGARAQSLIPFPFEEQAGAIAATQLPGVELVLATDDGSVGLAGSVVDALAERIGRSPVDSSRVTLYSCGPEPMLRAVAAFCATRSIECFVCLERSMACGVGTCQSCVVPVADSTDSEGWRYALCCTEGPVFRAEEVIWDRVWPYSVAVAR